MFSRIVVATVVVTAFTAGCGKDGGTPAQGPSVKVTPAVKTLTLAQAQAVLGNYEKVNNQANAKVSDALLRSNETGPMLEADLAANKRIRAKKEKKIKPFVYHKPQFFIPRGVSPAWFVTTAVATSGGTEFLVFVDAGGGAYKAAEGPWLAKGQKAPTIARGADGSATAVTAGPALKIGTRYATYLTAVAAGRRAPGGLASGPLTTPLAKGWAASVRRTNGGHRWSGGVKWTPRAEPVYALKTADGGTLVIDAANQSETYAATGPNVWFRPDSSFFGLGPERYYQRFSGERGWEVATYVPARGRASVLADAVHPLSATGS
ncbi:hypothetical protein [Actinomadura sp. DC4]|uniref:hypothetical protein n=1 Tax=Actinomadura sp. DC4 TaxID=3055069 RepID=UPI0025B08999|nr:hypothetical protein [Actinomadura sp. DC4]MDN3351256.1 hypothetical protein [Actinomadura sp. DC4]